MRFLKRGFDQRVTAIKKKSSNKARPRKWENRSWSERCLEKGKVAWSRKSWFLIKGTRKSKSWSFKFRPSKSSPRKLNSHLDLEKPHQYLQKCAVIKKNERCDQKVPLVLKKVLSRSLKRENVIKNLHRSSKSFSQKLQNLTLTHTTPQFKLKIKNLTSRALFINNHSKLSLFYIYYHLWHQDQ